MRHLFLLALVFLLIVFLPKKQTTAQSILISPQRAKILIQGKKAFLLDVHTPEQSHIPGSDAFIPFDQIESNADKLPQDKSTPILVYCRSGSMSKIASDQLIKMGYSLIYDLEGGINAYREFNTDVIIFPLEKDLGRVIYGDIAKTSFTLTNFTPSPLTVKRVSTSCGCTKAKVEKEKLDPYESILVEVSFDPAVHKDDTDLGELTRTIYIETDNPNFAKLTMDIKANVIKK